MNSIADQIKHWRESAEGILDFVRDCFGATPDEWQREALLAFSQTDDPRKFRIAMKACVGPGKSVVLVWCALWFLTVMGEKGDHPKAAVVSITADNLKDNFWAELSKWHKQSALHMNLFQWTKEKYFAKDHPETWFLTARSFQKKADEATLTATLSGLHSGYMLFILDETGEMPPAILKAAEQAMSTGKWCKVIQAGNPMSTNGVLYEACMNQTKDWWIVTITGDPLDPKRSPRIKMDWAQRQIDRYGREDPWVMFSILGQFPKTSVNTLLGPEEIREAMKRTITDTSYMSFQKRTGTDVARFGDDKTIIAKRWGKNGSYDFVEMRSARSNEIASRVLFEKAEFGSEMDFIDGTGGYGSGVEDQFLLMGYSFIVVIANAKGDEPLRFYNKRAEIYWRLQEHVKNGGSLPNDEDLVAELQIQFTYKGGRMLMEDKDQLKERIKRSPDKGDAFAQTFALPEMPRNAAKEGLGASEGGVEQDYDPYDPKRY